jgi:hypothetical protein
VDCAVIAVSVIFENAGAATAVATAAIADIAVMAKTARR